MPSFRSMVCGHRNREKVALLTVIPQKTLMNPRVLCFNPRVFRAESKSFGCLSTSLQSSTSFAGQSLLPNTSTLPPNLSARKKPSPRGLSTKNNVCLPCSDTPRVPRRSALDESLPTSHELRRLSSLHCAQARLHASGASR